MQGRGVTGCCLRRYEYQLQQVVGYRGLYARMQARQKRVQEMQNALTGVEQRISRMGDHHARHTQEAREHRHHQQEISHQMLRVRIAMSRSFCHTSKARGRRVFRQL
jgi:type II secretory pathway component PulJ